MTASRPYFVGIIVVIFLAFFGGILAISRISGAFDFRSLRQNNTFTSVSPYLFNEWIHTDNTVLIDLRPREDFSKGHIASAIHIDKFSLLPEYNLNKMTFLVYTEKGSPDYEYSQKIELIEKGNIVDLDGGYESWIVEGYPVERSR